MTELRKWTVKFKEEFPAFARTATLPDPTNLFFNDTRMIAIIGLGKRREVVVSAAAGNGADGEPVNFIAGAAPSGRFFKTASFPLAPNTFKVYRGFNGLEQVAQSDYLLDETLGYYILFTPLQTGERLIVEYISKSDIDYPRVYNENQLEDLYKIYGSPSADNSLSAGAQIAFANGAPRVVVVQGDHSGTDPSWFLAYAALERQQVYMIVPMTTGYYAQVAVAGMDHVQRMSETPYRRERILLIGEHNDTNELNTLPRTAISDYNNEERVIFIAADFAQTILAGESAAASGGYLAAAVAGAWASTEYPAATLTSKDLARITLNWPTDKLYSEKELRQIISQGLTLLLKGPGRTYIHRFTTTIANGLAVEEEPSVWRIRDYVAIQLRELLENRYVGTPSIIGLSAEVAETTETFLKGLLAQNIITKYQGVAASTDAFEPRQMNVRFDIQPVFPLNDLMITIRVSSSL